MVGVYYNNNHNVIGVEGVSMGRQICLKSGKEGKIRKKGKNWEERQKLGSFFHLCPF